MKKLALLLGPALVGYLWRRRSSDDGRLPAAAVEPDLDHPEHQTEAMEAAVDVPGGVRP